MPRNLIELQTWRVHIHYSYGIRSQNHNRGGLLGPNSIMVAYMDPLGEGLIIQTWFQVDAVLIRKTLNEGVTGSLSFLV